MEHARSPLDPLLSEFLKIVAAAQPGFSPTSRRGVATAAKVIDVPPELVDALFISARSRGFIKPVAYGRSRMLWQLSTAGEMFLGHTDAANPAQGEASQSPGF